MTDTFATHVATAVCKVLDGEATRLEVEEPVVAAALRRSATWLAIQTLNGAEAVARLGEAVWPSLESKPPEWMT